jgi:hypothetical protein
MKNKEEDHVHDGPGIGRRPDGDQHLADGTIRTVPVRKERDQSEPQSSRGLDAALVGQAEPQLTRPISESRFPPAVELTRQPLAKGSTSSRASAERTLSSIPFLSSPIGANGKSSNSDARTENEAERVISTTEFVVSTRSVPP